MEREIHKISFSCWLVTYLSVTAKRALETTMHHHTQNHVTNSCARRIETPFALTSASM